MTNRFNKVITEVSGDASEVETARRQQAQTLLETARKAEGTSIEEFFDETECELIHEFVDELTWHDLWKYTRPMHSRVYSPSGEHGLYEPDIPYENIDWQGYGICIGMLTFDNPRTYTYSVQSETVYGYADKYINGSLAVYLCDDAQLRVEQVIKEDLVPDYSIAYDQSGENPHRVQSGSRPVPRFGCIPIPEVSIDDNLFVGKVKRHLHSSDDVAHECRDYLPDGDTQFIEDILEQQAQMLATFAARPSLPRW